MKNNEGKNTHLQTDSPDMLSFPLFIYLVNHIFHNKLWYHQYSHNHASSHMPLYVTTLTWYHDPEIFLDHPSRQKHNTLFLLVEIDI